jgi:hypothetical protein
MAANPSDSQAKSRPEGRTATPFFESIAVLLLSLATVGTAWCSFQAASWGALAQGYSNQSGARARVAAQAELQAQQMAVLDVVLFSQYINARAASNEPLARYYSERFRDEAKAAFTAWMATGPFENTNAPPHPFVTNFYQPRLMAEARRADAESAKLGQQAGEAGRTSRNYVLLTVLLASALFCGGTASKFETRWIRDVALLLGMALFIFAVARLWALPTQS